MLGTTKTALPFFNIHDANETAQRALEVRQSKEGQYHLVGLMPDGRGIISDDPSEMPVTKVLQVQKPLTAAQALAEVRVAGDQAGLDLIEWDSDTKTVKYGRLLPVVRKTRALWARNLGVQPHEIPLFFEYDEHEPHLKRVGARFPAKSPKAQTRAELLAELAPAIDGYSNGWTQHENPLNGDATFTWGAPRVLPDKVPITSLLPERYAPEEWDAIPLGIASTGRPVFWRPKLSPHGLLAGATGSGKTQGLMTHIANGVARGHDYVLVDPLKGGADYKPLWDYLMAKTRSELEPGVTMDDAIEDAAALFKAAYAEGQRRKRLCLEHGKGFWANLPAEVREREGVRALNVIADEFTSLIAGVGTIPTLPKGTDPNSDIAREVAALQRVKLAKDTIAVYAGKIAREMRAWGVYLWVGLQVAKQEALGGGDLRENLLTGIQYVKAGQEMRSTTLGFLYPGESADAAAAEFAALGGKPGLAVIAQEESGPVGFRGGFLDEEDPAATDALVAHLASLSIPRPRPLDVTLGGPSGAPTGAAPAPLEPTGGFEWE